VPTRLFALSLLLVGACAPFRYVAVADHANVSVEGRPEPRTDRDMRVVDSNDRPDLAYCKKACGFALAGGEEVVECRRVPVSTELDARLHYPGGWMTVCSLR
jgi:hypothetical protein